MIQVRSEEGKKKRKLSQCERRSVIRETEGLSENQKGEEENIKRFNGNGMM